MAKSKIIATVVKDPRSTIDEGTLGFNTFPTGRPESEVLSSAKIRLRLADRIDRYVQQIYKNNYGFNKTKRDHWGRGHVPKTILKLEELLFIMYGFKIEVEIK